MNFFEQALPPLVTVVAVNYNCKKWLDRFFSSLRTQTIFNQIEVIIVDNTSTDGSAEICEKEMASWPKGVFLPTGGNYGFGGGNNRGAAIAHGKYLFFVNPDVWLEADCLEKLFKESESVKAPAGCAIVLDYDSDNVQVAGASGFDFFGNMTVANVEGDCTEPFAVSTFFFIDRDFFQKIGGFDNEFFLYNEEMDLSWRTWIAGGSIHLFRSAKIHHQGASTGDKSVENRTHESKRFYANRSQLLTILKNSHCLLLVLVLNQIALIAIEAVAGALLARRISFVRWSLVKPIVDCWRLRKHILSERKKIRQFRVHGDWWMLRRFFRLEFGRWADVKRLLKSGVKIDKA
jgi:GT2 family glycosyltransferase